MCAKYCYYRHFTLKSQILSKNPGLSQTNKISRIISGEIRNDDKDLAELSPGDISCFKYVSRRENKFFEIHGDAT